MWKGLKKTSSSDIEKYGSEDIVSLQFASTYWDWDLAELSTNVERKTIMSQSTQHLM
ncbi:hypothetical protein CY34DRAFT_806774, partial [Suillus luteus UH-Slu-Lm8-n1]